MGEKHTLGFRILVWLQALSGYSLLRTHVSVRDSRGVSTQGVAVDGKLRVFHTIWLPPLRLPITPPDTTIDLRHDAAEEDPNVLIIRYSCCLFLIAPFNNGCYYSV